MTLRIYTDTSVIGGCLDREFQVPSSRLVEKFKPREAVIVLSQSAFWNWSTPRRKRIRGYTSVNLRQGYPALEIRSPLEVFVDEKS